MYIIQMADLHIGSDEATNPAEKEFLEESVELIKKTIPRDEKILVCICGDIIDSKKPLPEEIEKRYTQFLQYAAKNLLASSIAEKIIKMNCNEEARHAKDPSCSAVCNDRQQWRIENRI